MRRKLGETPTGVRYESIRDAALNGFEIERGFNHYGSYIYETIDKDALLAGKYDTEFLRELPRCEAALRTINYRFGREVELLYLLWLAGAQVEAVNVGVATALAPAIDVSNPFRYFEDIAKTALIREAAIKKYSEKERAVIKLKGFRDANKLFSKFKLNSLFNVYSELPAGCDAKVFFNEAITDSSGVIEKEGAEVVEDYEGLSYEEVQRLVKSFYETHLDTVIMLSKGD